MKNLVLKVTLVSCALLGTSVANAQDHTQCYNLASIKGSYGTVGTYGANLALAVAVRYYDGKGNFTATFTVNEPDPTSTTGGRKIVTGTNVGTYTVNCDGTGQTHKTTTTSTGTSAESVEDFVITTAKVKDGQLIATSIEDAQETPSSIVPGGVFLIHHLTRRPDANECDEGADKTSQAASN
jgi:hypothetical protein